MARARNIKPKFFENEDLAELSALTRLAFIGMWTISDFKGCIEFRPKRLKIQILPYDDCDFEEIANSLDKSGFIRMYSIQGQRYIKIINFEKHQNPHKNEKEAGSEIPDIDENNIIINDLKEIEINPDKNGTTRADSLFPLPDSLNLNPVDTKPQAATAAPKYSFKKELLDSGMQEQAVADWLAVRKVKKSADTKTAMDAIKREAEVAGLTLAQAATYACENGWSGFKAAWHAAEQEKKKFSGSTAPWWSSDALILAEGEKMGMRPNAGEYMPAFKGRVQSAIDNGGKPPAAPRSTVTTFADEKTPQDLRPAPGHIAAMLKNKGEDNAQ